MKIISIAKDEQSAEILSNRRYPILYIAAGSTYANRERLQSWAWFYIGHLCKDKSTWAAEHIHEEDDPCLLVIQDIKGVKVTKIDYETPPKD